MRIACCWEGCIKDPIYTFKLCFRPEEGDGYGEAYLDIDVCEDHRMTDAAVEKFLAHNWERLCFAFQEMQRPRPSLARSTWQWVPITEAEQFRSEASAHVKKTWKN